MRKYLGVLLVIVGLAILVTNLFPQYRAYLYYLRFVTRLPFWGVVFVLLGGYFVSRSDKTKSVLGIALVAFVAMYLLASAAGTATFTFRGWSIPTFFDGRERITEPPRVIGDYRVPEIEIKDLAARIVFQERVGETTEISTNLPLTVDELDGKVVLSCETNCRRYKNGEIMIRVGEGQVLEKLQVRNTVGDIELALTRPLARVIMSNFVGSLTASGLASEEVSLSDFIGDISLEISSLDRFQASSGIGDLKVTLPADHRLKLTSEALLARVNTQGDIHQGDREVEFGVRNMIGQVTISKPEGPSGES